MSGSSAIQRKLTKVSHKPVRPHGPGPFGGAFRGAPSQAGGGVLPNVFSPYAYPGYRPDAGAGANAAIATYRTLCVRLCDGFYFPISFATPEGGLARDAEQCRASCGVEARLFYHLNPGGSVESMMDLRAAPTARCRPPSSIARPWWPVAFADRCRYPRRPARSVPRGRWAPPRCLRQPTATAKRQFPARLRRVRPRASTPSPIPMPCRRYSDRRRWFATSSRRRWARPRAGGSGRQRLDAPNGQH